MQAQEVTPLGVFAFSAWKIFSAEIGSSVNRTPTASCTAFAMAAQKARKVYTVERDPQVAVIGKADNGVGELTGILGDEHVATGDESRAFEAVGRGDEGPPGCGGFDDLEFES